MQLIRQIVQPRFQYPVYFTSNLFSKNNPVLREAASDARSRSPGAFLFVLDSGVVRHHPHLIGDIQAYCQVYQTSIRMVGAPILIEGGEGAKNHPEYVSMIHGAVHQARLCRHSFLVVVGGGAVLDMVGYAAATAHRGIRLIRVPTTVLSQDDSGVGVKNGINAFGKKNFLGTFTPPYAVLNDFEFLTTLSDRDWRSGIAEAIKVALIQDIPFFRFIEEHAEKLSSRHMETMRELIYRCAERHLRHIAFNGDPFELGSSRPLDFGHWSAHKLEQLTGHALRHGEAVAIGIALDTTYSYLAGFLSEFDWRRILQVLSAVGFSLSVPEQAGVPGRPEDPAPLLEGLAEFREHLGGELTVMLLRGIGEKLEVDEIDPEILRQSISLLRKNRKESCVS